MASGRCWSGFTERYVPFLARSFGFLAVYVGVSLVVGLALLETPFSLPFAVTASILMVLLGAATIFRVLRGWPCAPQPPTAKVADDARSRTWSTIMNYVLAFFLAALAVLAGVFTLWIYFRAKKIAPMTRLAMFIVLGAALTTIITHNLLVVIQDIADCVGERPATTKGGLTQSRPGNPLARGALAVEHRNKQHAIQFVSYLAVGVYYGFMYGQLAGTEIAVIVPRTHYDPWPPVATYLEYSLPVAGAVGFLTGLLVSYMALETSSSPLPPSAQSNAGAPGANKGGLAVGAAAPVRDSAAGGGDPSPVGGKDGAKAGLAGAAPAGGRPAAATMTHRKP